MISRRSFFRFAFFGLVSVYSVSAFAQATDAETTLTADVLIKTLYARTAADKKFCENVIAARDAQILPNRILYAAYRYALKKDTDRRFTYFQTLLLKSCKEAGITLPTAAPTKTSYNPFTFLTSPFKSGRR